MERSTRIILTLILSIIAYIIVLGALSAEEFLLGLARLLRSVLSLPFGFLRSEGWMTLVSVLLNALFWGGVVIGIDEWLRYRRSWASRQERDALLCKQCRYDLRGSLGSENCPECGARIPMQQRRRIETTAEEQALEEERQAKLRDFRWRD